MKNSIFILLISLFFISCSTYEAMPKEKSELFLNEDTYILLALRAEEIKDYQSSADIFNKLYKSRKKREYIYRSLQNSLTLKKYDSVIKRVDTLEISMQQDNQIRRYKIVSLVGLKKFSKAEKLAIKLLEDSDEINDYILLSDIYISLNESNKALEYLEVAYKKNYDDIVIDKISLLLYLHLDRKKEAIQRVETHYKIHGNSLLISKRLVSLYSSENDIDGLLSALLRLYKLDANLEYSKKIVQIYSYKKDYLKLMNFLERSKSDNVSLLQLYSTFKNYDKAYLLAYNLYFDTGDLNYLGQSAIYEYESSKNKSDKIMLNGVIEKLKTILEQKASSLYLNYLGYLLIDHSIDVKKGMKYVQNALVLEPKSAYYLDSLAWGHYKLGNCKKAKKIMREVIKLDDSENEEVVFHLHEIDRCLKN